jgi:hypothetical protein
MIQKGIFHFLTVRNKVLILGTFNSSLFFLKIQEDHSLKKLGEYVFSEQFLDKKFSIPNSLLTVRARNGEFRLIIGLRDGTVVYLHLDMDLISNSPNFLSLCITILQSTSLGSTPVSIMNSGVENAVLAFSDTSAWLTVKDDTFGAKKIILKPVSSMKY